MENRHSVFGQVLNLPVVIPLSNRWLITRLATVAVGAVIVCSATTTPAATADKIGVNVVPHRAIYRLSLQSARSASPVIGVSGRMLFQWSDACDAWTIEQHFRMNFLYAEDEEVMMTTNYATWEAKNGGHYRFNVRKTVNGQVEEELKGEATTGNNNKVGKGGRESVKGGIATFAKPEATEIKLPPGTQFPTRHTLVLLEHALAGEHFFTRTIFDGADAEGATEISAVIGKRAMLKNGIAATSSIKDRPALEVLVADAKRDSKLLTGPAWPVRLAFFPTKSESSSPEYEMSLLLLHNGIAEAMQIDYGDFTVKAILETLEPLPKSGC
ncbi:MAG: cell envelope integrity EipB family protein [Rhodospirillaceae bacterium]